MKVHRYNPWCTLLKDFALTMESREGHKYSDVGVSEALSNQTVTLEDNEMEASHWHGYKRGVGSGMIIPLCGHVNCVSNIYYLK